METIYDFTDEMMSSHNELKEARDKFAELVEKESRGAGLTERHRGRWIDKVHIIEQNAGLMVKETPIAIEPETTIADVNEDMGFTERKRAVDRIADIVIKTNGEIDWRKKAKSLGINTFQKSKEWALSEIAKKEALLAEPQVAV